jgi:Signal transduction histidine kinase
MGLGLTVACNIINSHDGELAVRSQPGVGSMFTVMLPVV